MASFLEMFLALSVGLSMTLGISSLKKMSDRLEARKDIMVLIQTLNYAKEKALLFGWSKVTISDDVRVMWEGAEKVFKLKIRISEPDVRVKACSNRKGKPRTTLKTVKFSRRGTVSGISGAVYFELGGEHYALTLVAPQGLVRTCYLKGSKWELYD